MNCTTFFLGVLLDSDSYANLKEGSFNNMFMCLFLLFFLTHINDRCKFSHKDLFVYRSKLWCILLLLVWADYQKNIYALHLELPLDGMPSLWYDSMIWNDYSTWVDILKDGYKTWITVNITLSRLYILINVRYFICPA